MRCHELSRELVATSEASASMAHAPRKTWTGTKQPLDNGVPGTYNEHRKGEAKTRLSHPFHLTANSQVRLPTADAQL